MMSIDSVSTTVAVAAAPSFETQKMSASENSDSISISATIGIARSRIARRTGNLVKSCRVPASASRTSAINPSRRRVVATTSAAETVAVSVVILVSSCPDDEAPTARSTTRRRKCARTTKMPALRRLAVGRSAQARADGRRDLRSRRRRTPPPPSCEVNPRGRVLTPFKPRRLHDIAGHWGHCPYPGVPTPTRPTLENQLKCEGPAVPRDRVELSTHGFSVSETWEKSPRKSICLEKLYHISTIKTEFFTHGKATIESSARRGEGL